MMNTKPYGEILSNYVKAGSQSCSPQILEAMAHSEIDRIRLRVAENPNTPIEVLELLATDRNIDVRSAVGTNPSTPAYLSYQIAFDEDPNVRLGLADDINTPIEVLEKLTEDVNPYVSYRARQTINIAQSQGKARRIGFALFKWTSKGMDHPRQKYA